MLIPRQGDHMGPILSMLFVAAGMVAPCVWWLVVAARGFWKNARLASAAAGDADGHVVLRPGRVALRGHVVVPKGQNFAMRVEIDLQGREWKVKSSYNHAWSEKARRVLYHPFQIRLDSGKLLDVRPDASTQLVDRLDQLKVVSRTQRIKTAELSPGERVYLIGELRKEVDLSGEFVDFREPPAPKWVVHADLLSAEPLEDKYRARRNFYLRWLFWGLALAAIVHGGIGYGYYLRMHKGRVVAAIVTAKRHFSTGSGKGRTQHYQLSLQWDTDSGREDASSSSFGEIKQGDVVPILVVADEPKLTQLGNRPTIHWGNVLGALLLLGCCGGLFADRRKTSRPWYWQDKLEYGDSGRLPPV